MKKYIYLLVLITLGTFQSCTSDLDVVSTDDDILSADRQFSTIDGYKSAIAGVYSNLGLIGTAGPDTSNILGLDSGTGNFTRSLLNLQELSTDEMCWSWADAGVVNIQYNNWTASNELVLGMYSRTMLSVAFANNFLRESTPEKLASRNITNANDLAAISLYRNEARVLKAYAYYNIMDLFGKAIVYSENDAIGSKGTAYTRKELFDYIEKEIKEALPNLNATRTLGTGRINQSVAKMILAKMFLNATVYTNENRNNDCVAMCESIIADGYSLNPNYKNNFNADNHTSQEMLFAIQNDGVNAQSWGASTVLISAQIGSSSLGMDTWSGGYRLRKEAVLKFEGSKFANDSRNTLLKGTTNKPRTIDINDLLVPDQGYGLNKFSNLNANGTEGSDSGKFFADMDFPVFRLADVYLMYAEATLRGGNGTPAKALEYVNALRKRANNNTNDGEISLADLTLDFILDERMRELHLEGHRRQDLIRFGKFTGSAYNWAWKGGVLAGRSIENFRNLYPIPSNSLNVNTNLTQNPGY